MNANITYWRKETLDACPECGGREALYHIDEMWVCAGCRAAVNPRWVEIPAPESPPIPTDADRKAARLIVAKAIATATGETADERIAEMNKAIHAAWESAAVPVRASINENVRETVWARRNVPTDMVYADRTTTREMYRRETAEELWERLSAWAEEVTG